MNAPFRICSLCFLEIALTTSDDIRMTNASLRLAERLSSQKRRILATIALSACEYHDALECANNVLAQKSFGMPLPALLDPKSEAEWWASNSTFEELKACLVACYNAVPKAIQRDFIEFANVSIDQ